MLSKNDSFRRCRMNSAVRCRTYYRSWSSKTRAKTPGGGARLGGKGIAVWFDQLGVVTLVEARKTRPFDFFVLHRSTERPIIPLTIKRRCSALRGRRTRRRCGPKRGGRATIIVGALLPQWLGSICRDRVLVGERGGLSSLTSGCGGAAWASL